ncbi:dihydrolipoyl dehydrogenase [Falsirhodobacter sp. 20TX0035]|uniref:dihydrolipoyl dehydrogenase n=1 Tax=Falsirhodobacter sp. 20TX0035 TaxID=3022019 RepID=UPI00232CDF10|nr:dihydrolipoyl dehydrogenase [Falsirhodobacter sp. 20TX0035]MDB6453470.1 dihydrolipoyl dehydrogenase [Falsirhodobacter sp. 20TX0035]
MTSIDCDVAVIGAGTAGLAAERHARKNGARTVLIDPAFRGTTCAAVGCMPSKLLIAAASAAHAVRQAPEFGVNAKATVDGKAVMARVRALRDHFVAGVKDSYDEVPQKLKGRARFTSATTLKLDSGEEVTAKAIVIATGAAPSVPKEYEVISDLVLTNETVFELEDLPKRLGVIGAGSLGAELAQAFARLGVEVTLLDSGTGVAGLKGEEAACMADFLREDMAVHLEAEVKVARDGAAARLDWDGGSVTVDRILVAAGRPPALKGLGLEAAGIELDDHGTPVFDKGTLRCGSSTIFIAGDANHDRPVLHEATAEGSIAGRNAANLSDIRSAQRKVPMAIAFTHPNVATVGHVPERTETVTGQADYADQGRARVEARNRGFVRLEGDAEGRILSATLCMPDGEHVAHYFALAISQGMTAAEMLDQPIYHPTVEEGLRKALSQICQNCNLPVPWDRRSGPQPGDI